MTSSGDDRVLIGQIIDKILELVLMYEVLRELPEDKMASLQ